MQHDPTTENNRVVHDLLLNMSPNDRIMELIGAIFARDPRPYRCAGALAAIAGSMADYLSASERIAVAVILRESADAIDATVH
jgi:hypothetical protein